MRSLIIDGIDTFKDWGLVLSSKELAPPSPKFYTVEVPGGDGDINLTESLNGDAVYNNRQQKFVFTMKNPYTSFEALKTKVSNFLNGREFDYKLSWDADYTYHGRFEVSAYASDKALNKITISIVANPYKMRDVKPIRVYAAGGILVKVPSGRKRVRPTIRVNTFCTVECKGVEMLLPKGSWLLNDIIFTEGENELYLCTREVDYLTWGELEDSGISFGGFEKRPFFEWAKSSISEFYEPIAKSEEDMVTIEYEWGDL